MARRHGGAWRWRHWAGRGMRRITWPESLRVSKVVLRANWGSCRGVVSAPAPGRDAEPCGAAVAPTPAQALGARPGFRALAGLLSQQHLQTGK